MDYKNTYLILAITLLIIGSLVYNFNLQSSFSVQNKNTGIIDFVKELFGNVENSQLSPIENLYPILLEPFTQYSSTIYPSIIPSEPIPILSGNYLISGTEARGYFDKKLGTVGNNNAETTLLLSPQGTNNFIQVNPISGRAANGLFDSVIDTTKYPNGLYTLRIILTDPDTDLTGTLDEPVLIDNSQPDLTITGAAISSEEKCECKKAEIRNGENGNNAYHNVGSPRSQGGPYFVEVPYIDPVTRVTSPGFFAGITFSTHFLINGNPNLCGEGQGVRSSTIIGESGRVISYDLTRGFPDSPLLSRSSGTNGYNFPVPGSRDNFIGDNYEITMEQAAREGKPTGLKSHTDRSIFMTDSPGVSGPLSVYPEGFLRTDHFLSEVTNSHPDADGIKRKCRCFLDLAFGNLPGSNTGIRQEECVSDVPVTCGNKKLDPGEECDDGNLDLNDQCGMDCKFTSCGDGRIQSPNGAGGIGGFEQCDPPKDKCTTGGIGIPKPGICSGTCQCIPTCGNGKLDPGEECESNGATTPGCEGDICNLDTCKCETSSKSLR
ncbi:hypothetical protein J4416_02485 [Candidatus Pacearchaeota archaeon]|nr:hypothetical protein [Candidatus Pacearchaeota archaeon]